MGASGSNIPGSSVKPRSRIKSQPPSRSAKLLRPNFSESSLKRSSSFKYQPPSRSGPHSPSNFSESSLKRSSSFKHQSPSSSLESLLDNLSLMLSNSSVKTSSSHDVQPPSRSGPHSPSNIPGSSVKPRSRIKSQPPSSSLESLLDNLSLMLSDSSMKRSSSFEFLPPSIPPPPPTSEDSGYAVAENKSDVGNPTHGHHVFNLALVPELDTGIPPDKFQEDPGKPAEITVTLKDPAATAVIVGAEAAAAA